MSSTSFCFEINILSIIREHFDMQKESMFAWTLSIGQCSVPFHSVLFFIASYTLHLSDVNALLMLIFHQNSFVYK